MPTSRNWQDLAWTDFAALPANTVAILPVAAIEQHGPHLPLSTDAAINAGLLTAALDLLPPDIAALALPMQSVGLSVEHIRFPGTLTLSAETLIAVLTEIGRSVARAGINRLVILNTHGGQPAVIEIVCRRLRADGVFAVNCMASHLGLPPELVLTDAESRHGIHGGLVETSLMLHLHPEQVAMPLARDFRSAWLARATTTEVLSPEGAVSFGWETQDLHPAGALGDAAAAASAIGQAILTHQANRLARLIQDIAAFNLQTWFRSAPEPAGGTGNHPQPL